MLLLQLTVPIITCCGRPRRANRTPPSCMGRTLAPRRRTARGRRLVEEFCWPSTLAVICSSMVTFLHRRCCSLWNWSRAFIAHIYAWLSEFYREQQNGWFKRNCGWNLITKSLVRISSIAISMETCSKCLQVYPLTITDVTVATQHSCYETPRTLRVWYLLGYVKQRCKCIDLKMGELVSY